MCVCVRCCITVLPWFRTYTEGKVMMVRDLEEQITPKVKPAYIAAFRVIGGLAVS